MRSTPEGPVPVPWPWLPLALLIGLAAAQAAGPGAEPEDAEELKLIRTQSAGTIAAPTDRPLVMPSDAAVGADGTLYVLDGVNDRVLAFNAEGELRFVFGKPGSGPGEFRHTLGITTGPGGTVHVADSAGKLLTFETPTGIAVDAARKRLYVVELKPSRVRWVDLE